MKKFIFLLVLSTGCHSSVYLVVGNNTFNTEQSKPRLKKLILLDDKYFEHNQELIEMLNKKRWPELELAQRRMDRQSSEFLQAIRLMILSNYNASYELLKNLPDDAFECETQILRADCLHDLHRTSVDSLYEQYQRAADCSRNSTIKELAKKRFLFVKHGY